MTTPSHTRRRDRSQAQILAVLHERGPSTRLHIADATGLSKSAVNALVSDMLHRGILAAEPSRGPSASRGRPSELLTPAVSHGSVLGLDFGHNHIRVAIASHDATILAEDQIAIDVDSHPQEAITTTRDLVDALCDKAGVAPDDIRSAAAGFPGPVDPSSGTVGSTVIMSSWDALDVSAELGRALGVRVRVENDAVMGALGEVRFGAAQHCENVVYVKASHGVGAGVLVDGRPLRGSHGFAGEIGHIRVPGLNELCRCGNRGCLEAGVGVDRLIQQFAAIGGSGRDGQPITDTGALAATVQGRSLLAGAGRLMGQILAYGCSWLDPQAIVIGGELGTSGEYFVDGVRESLHRFSPLSSTPAAAIRSGALGQRAEVMGAVAAALQDAATPAGGAGVGIRSTQP